MTPALQVGSGIPCGLLFPFGGTGGSEETSFLGVALAWRGAMCSMCISSLLLPSNGLGLLV